MRGRKKQFKCCEICGISSDESIITKTKIDNEEKILCSKHYQLLKKFGRDYSLHDLKRKRICDVCGIPNDEVSIFTTDKFGERMSLCKKHYEQIFNNGKFSNKKSNEFIEHELYIEMILFDRDGNVCGSTIFSKEHLEEVKKYKWWLSKGRWYTDYVYGKSGAQKTSLHGLICKLLYGNPPEGFTPDHLNRNGKDNTNENLKYKDASDQVVNQGISKRNTSGIKGVSVYKEKWWRVRLMYREKELTEIFSGFEEAVQRRRQWEEIRDKGDWLNYYDKYNSSNRA